MKKRTWKVIAVISFAAAVILTAVVLRIYTQREHARQTYEEMQQQNSEKRQTDTQESKEQSKTKKKKKKLDIPVDFETLQKENSDIYAWITIPGTDIDYPVVQDSTDNTYYLNHAADTSLSDSGAIYSEKENAKDFDDYLRCKSLLLKQCKVGIVNRDDEHFEKIIEGHTCSLETYGFSPEADLRAEDAKLVGGKGYLGISYHLKGLLDFHVEIDIPGKFSIYNSLTAIAICRHFKVSEENILKALKVAKVKGRIEMVKVSDDFTLMIDYAHNAMALESLLTTLKEYHPHRLVCLFGCGGNRSKLRRYEMGEVSGKLADLTIITSDNPRDEEPQAIIDDIKVGMAKTDGKYVEIADRKEAIAYAIHHGEPGDIIVLAGKGHEDYQEIKGKKYPMDERVLIADILAGK